MKKSVCFFICVTLLLSACQPTPGEPFVVRKDYDAMLEQAGIHAAEKEAEAPQPQSPKKPSLAEQLGVPKENYVFFSEELSGRLTIRADAPAECPDVVEVPVVQVVKSGFSQEQVYRLFDHLYPDTLPFDLLNGSQSKEDVERTILQYKMILADGSYAQQGLTEAMCSEIIAHWEKTLTEMPENTSGYGHSDGSFSQRKDGDGAVFNSLEVSTSSNHSADFGKKTIRNLSVMTPNDESPASQKKDRCYVRYLYYDAQGRLAERYKMENAVRITAEHAVPEECLSVSLSEAEAFCTAFLQDVGGGSFSLGAAFLSEDAESGKHAYRLYFSRNLNNVPVFPNMRLGTGDSEFAEPWSHEYICFVVDESGIIYINWQNPIAVRQTIAENAELLPFDEIKAVFEKMICTEYTAFVQHWYGEDGRADIWIDRIYLCLVRVRIPNEDAGLLVPAWVFEGNSIAESSDGLVYYDVKPGTAYSEPGEPFPLLIVNAVDGSIIDLYKGF